MDINHPNNLQAFVEGQLNEAEINLILNHIGDCDQCLETVDALWVAQAVADVETNTLTLDTNTAKRLEGRVLRHIHRSDLAGRVVWLGTSGVISTYLTMLPPVANICLAMLRPLFMLGRPSKFDKDSKR